MRPVLDRIVGTTVIYLQQGDYLEEGESEHLLAAYGEQLDAASGIIPDFLEFVAGYQAQKHTHSAEGELSRMQSLLRSSLNDRVHCWSFGPLPGRASALYEHCPVLRPVCMALGCPAILTEETSIVHVASLNPVSALASSFWISQELNRTSEGDAPFVFSFFTDLPAWQLLMQRHFAP